jgi:hypothetical protein
MKVRTVIDLGKMNKFKADFFVEIQKFECGGRLKVKINTISYGDNL